MMALTLMCRLAFGVLLRKELTISSLHDANAALKRVQHLLTHSDQGPSASTSSGGCCAPTTARRKKFGTGGCFDYAVTVNFLRHL